MSSHSFAPGRPSASFPILVQRLLADQWPSSDRLAWVAACRPGRGMTPPGSAAKLRATTREKQEHEWGSYLRYLGTAGQLLDTEAVTDRLTPERLGGYIEAVLRFSRASTVRCRVIQLSYMAKDLMPDRSWSWVRKHPALPTEAEASAVRKQKAWCDPSEFVAKSLTQCDTAMQLPDPLLAAVRYRDGVLIAFAFCCTIRRKNLSELKIGESLIIAPDYVRVVFDETVVKNHRIVDMLLPDFLCPYVREYVQKHRPILLQGSADTGELWINLRGKPLSYTALYGVFTTRSQSLVQQRLHPHSTRYSLATCTLDNDPRDIGLAADSLGHRGTGTVARYYNQAGPARANAAWQKLFKEKTGGGK